LRRVRAKQAFAQPPVAPKNAIVDSDIMGRGSSCVVVNLKYGL
jgi:hypothetical protein